MGLSIFNRKTYFFTLFGVLNTLIDFTVFAILVHIGIGVILSNFFSTFTAVIFSFTMNRKYTFLDNGKKTGKKLFHFISITLVGLWVIQPLIIKTAIYLEGHIRFTSQRLNLVVAGISASVMVAKLIATLASMIWNFIWYNSVVFAPTNEES